MPIPPLGPWVRAIVGKEGIATSRDNGASRVSTGAPPPGVESNRVVLVDTDPVAVTPVIERTETSNGADSRGGSWLSQPRQLLPRFARDARKSSEASALAGEPSGRRPGTTLALSRKRPPA